MKSKVKRKEDNFGPSNGGRGDSTPSSQINIEGGKKGDKNKDPNPGLMERLARG